MPDFKKEEKVLIDKTKPLPELPVHIENVDHRDDFHESNITKPSSNKEFEIINTKLDLINARLENLNARLEALERMAYDERRKW